MAALVPDEIIETILLKLPIKSLLRFKSVSKSWNSIISDYNVFLHYNDCNCCVSLVRLEGQQFKIEERVWRPLIWRFDTYHFLCIGADLLLLNRSCDPNTYMLWNPCTRQETILRFPYYPDYSSNMYGVCYDPINEDIKVVVASMNFYTVYSCKNRSWTKKKDVSCRFVARSVDRRLSGRLSVDGGLSVDGAIYWICNKDYSGNQIIVCFDSKEDSFRILEKPEDDQCFDLKASKNRLYLCCYGEGEKTVKIWIKEKSGCSWKFLVNIDNLNNGRIRCRVVIALRKNEMIMCVGSKSYCIYNCCDKSYREFVNKHGLWGRLDPFLDSVFSQARTRENQVLQD